MNIYPVWRFLFMLIDNITIRYFLFMLNWQYYSMLLSKKEKKASQWRCKYYYETVETQ